jgi:hypothetical protein
MAQGSFKDGAMISTLVFDSSPTDASASAWVRLLQARHHGLSRRRARAIAMVGKLMQDGSVAFLAAEMEDDVTKAIQVDALVAALLASQVRHGG